MINRYQEYTLEKKFVTNNIEFCDIKIFFIMILSLKVRKFSYLLKKFLQE